MYRVYFLGLTVECDTVEELAALVGKNKPEKEASRRNGRTPPTKRRANPGAVTWAKVKKEAKRTNYEGDLRKLRSRMAKAAKK